MELEDAVRKPIADMSLGETIPPFSIPKKREERMVMLAQLMRSEVHLPRPESIYRNFDPEIQQEILDTLRGMNNRQLVRRIKEEQKRLQDEVMEQWPRGLAHP